MPPAATPRLSGIKPQRPPLITPTVLGADELNRAIKGFTAKDRVLVQRAAMRRILAPGRKALREATPRSAGIATDRIHRRKIHRGHPVIPAHAADTPNIRLRYHEPSQTLNGRLSYRGYWGWYIRILSLGFTAPSGSRVPPRRFATSVIDRIESEAINAFPHAVAIATQSRLRRRFNTNKWAG